MEGIRAAVPTVVLLALLVGTTVELCFGVISTEYGPSTSGIVLQVITLLLFAMDLWCFFTAAYRSSLTRDVGQSPGETQPLISDRRAFITVKRSTGAPRWCSKCNAPKPDRCHHCRQCGACVLRMDHHCPWVMHRCIGLRNHKAFFLLLIYGGIYCVYSAVVVGAAVTRAINSGEQVYISWITLFFISIVLGLVVWPFTGFHLYLILRNRTTLEYIEGMSHVQRRSNTRLNTLRTLLSEANSESRRRDHQRASITQDQRYQSCASRHNMYDVGICNNWHQVMGREWWLWLVPLGGPDSDGIHYPVDDDALRKLQGTLEGEVA